MAERKGLGRKKPETHPFEEKEKVRQKN